MTPSERKDTLDGAKGADGEFDIELEDALQDRPSKRHAGMSKDGKPRPSSSRAKRDSKFGFGGKVGRRAKQNTKESTDDIFGGGGRGNGKPVPGRLVDSHGSLESLLVVPNGLENRREWRSEESDCNDLFGLSVSGTGPEALNTYSMGTSILYTVFSRKADQYQAKISQDWKAIALNGTHLRNLLL
jgi:hypothetical protein